METGKKNIYIYIYIYMVYTHRHKIMRKREKEDEKQRLEAKRLKEVADHEDRRAGALFIFLLLLL